MIKTTITLPVELHYELQIIAKRQNKSLADVVRDLLQREFGQQKSVRMKAVYAALERVKAIDKDTPSHISATINTQLYGQVGAWKGWRE